MSYLRWHDVLPDKYRDAFVRQLKDPAIYSMRHDIALLGVYIERVLSEMAAGATPDPQAVEEGTRLVFSDDQGWGRILEALELRMKMIGQEVKTMDSLAAHGAKQWERAQALNAMVIETLRAHLAGTEEGKRVLLSIADELEQRVREMQLLDTKMLEAREDEVA